MILRSPFLLPSSSPNNQPYSPSPTHHHRRRLRRRQDITLRHHHHRRPHASLGEVFRSFVSSLPSPNLIAPALGLASAASLYLPSSSSTTPTDQEAVLFTTPTTFNRCVLLRCPSVSFQDAANHRLLAEEERHYVNLKGRTGTSEENEISYQRVCIPTDDGGVISLDWPDNLDMDKGHGLDTTLLIVPGTTEGSLDRDVRMFVGDALLHGFFPVVMNPRGCGGSPLTTASDDISTAIQFVNNFRPWTTLMSLGWGYGANMLTKYLAEAGNTSPLTATVCIDNPFNLEEATKSSTYHTALNQKLRNGLIDILRVNKELFQGKTKDFDVAKALSATTIREFDESISMIPYGFNVIDDFYLKTSTKKSVSSLKIPVLFIQSGDSMAPPFSVPRSSIAENPFTSLLLCSCLASTISRSERFSARWCHHIAIEWLSAVEFALLKGRHPLLEDVDVTFNPSKGLAYLDDIAPEWSISTESKSHWVKENDGAIEKFNRHSKPGSELQGVQRGEDIGTIQDRKVDLSYQNDEVNSNLAKEGDSPIDSEGSQVLQTASVVMKMLDVTLPGALEDEQKRKVLSAIERGETLKKALEGAVPEDVRGKITTAVSEIIQTHGTNLNIEGLKRIGWIPSVMSRIQEKFKGISTLENGNDTLRSDQRIVDAGTEGRTKDDSVFMSSGINDAQENNQSSQIESGSEKERKQRQAIQSEKTNTNRDEDIGEQYEVDQSSGVDTEPSSSDQVVNQSSGVDTEPSSSDQVVGCDVNDVQKNEGNKMDFVAEQNIPVPSSNSDKETSAVLSTSEQQVIEKEGNSIPKGDEKMIQDVADPNLQSSNTKSEEPLPDYSCSKPPSINVSQALNAITGFDDSTQMAVNSVFGVLENMIDQYEKTSNPETDEEANKTKDQESVDVPQELPVINKDESEFFFDNSNKTTVESDVDQTETSFNEEDDSHGKTDGNWDGNEESKVRCSLPSSANYSINWSQENDSGFICSRSSHRKKDGRVQNFPLEVAVNAHWKSPYGTYFRRYLSAHLSMFLDPVEGQWKMPNRTGSSRSTIGERGKNQRIDHSLSRQSDEEKVIEPSYLILDAEYSGPEHQLNEEYDKIEYDKIAYSSRKEDVKKEKFMCLMRNTLLDSLKIEVGRRLSMPDLRKLERGVVLDLEHVSDAVSQAAIYDTELNFNLLSKSNGPTSVKFGTVDAEHIIRTIASALQVASHLRKILPVGVVVGSSLASLRKYFEIAALHDGERTKATSKPGNIPDKFYDQEGYIKFDKTQHADSDKSNEDSEKTVTKSFNGDGVMVGAVTAPALDASVLLANHQHKKTYEDETNETPSDSYNEKDFAQLEHAKFEEATRETNQISLVGSLAEKAMSVAAPVVPRKSDGEVDQDRLVAILAELGQKGGILRLVGKLALLWGGVRGAMSLTDKLISFLHIGERPLFQRVLGFACLVFLLWSPVVIPFLPTLVQSWATKSSNRIAEYSCLVGLFVATVTLVMIWGKRVRGYDDPIKQYGLDFTSATRVREFAVGLIGGMLIVIFIHSINALLGYANLSWPVHLTSSSGTAIMLLKAYGSMLLRAIRSIVQVIGIALVEELLFRSWLTEEVAVDLGYYRAVMISGIGLSLIQRLLPSVPGLLLLSLALSGIKQRMNNQLFAPIGVRAGILSTNFVLWTGGFLTYQSTTPFWITSNLLWHPFQGVVGLSICAIMAIVFFPRPTSSEEQVTA